MSEFSERVLPMLSSCKWAEVVELLLAQGCCTLAIGLRTLTTIYATWRGTYLQYSVLVYLRAIALTLLISFAGVVTCARGVSLTCV